MLLRKVLIALLILGALSLAYALHGLLVPPDDLSGDNWGNAVWYLVQGLVSVVTIVLSVAGLCLLPRKQGPA